MSASTNWEDVYRVQKARIAELERENAALRADKERLQWLELRPIDRLNWVYDLVVNGQDIQSVRHAIDFAREDQP